MSTNPDTTQGYEDAFTFQTWFMTIKGLDERVDRMDAYFIWKSAINHERHEISKELYRHGDDTPTNYFHMTVNTRRRVGNSGQVSP